MDDFVLDSFLGKEVLLNEATVDCIYSKSQRVKNNVLQQQTIVIVNSKEFGRVCFSSRSKWIKEINEGDLVDVQVTLNLPGKDIVLAKRPKLLKRH